ncbi:MAG: hypothetical protein WBW81_07395 [Methylocella sp.]
MDDAGLQDGMLAHYLAQAKMSDTNVEARIEKEPFDFREMTRARLFAYLREKGGTVCLPAANEELRIAARRCGGK